jgi:hypothetical protein
MSDHDLPEDFKVIDHPMEDLLDIESGTTQVPAIPQRNTELVVADEYDRKDEEIEGQFQEVYDAAMDAYEQQVVDTETIEPKYRARNQEVAVQYLNTALNAAKEKSSLKQFKDKMLNDRKAASGPKTVNNNLVVADRNGILKQILGNKPEE